MSRGRRPATVALVAVLLLVLGVSPAHAAGESWVAPGTCRTNHIVGNCFTFDWKTPGGVSVSNLLSAQGGTVRYWLVESTGFFGVPPDYSMYEGLNVMYECRNNVTGDMTVDEAANQGDANSARSWPWWLIGQQHSPLDVYVECASGWSLSWLALIDRQRSGGGIFHGDDYTVYRSVGLRGCTPDLLGGAGRSADMNHWGDCAGPGSPPPPVQRFEPRPPDPPSYVAPVTACILDAFMPSTWGDPARCYIGFAIDRLNGTTAEVEMNTGYAKDSLANIDSATFSTYDFLTKSVYAQLWQQTQAQSDMVNSLRTIAAGSGSAPQTPLGPICSGMFASVICALSGLIDTVTSLVSLLLAALTPGPASVAALSDLGTSFKAVPPGSLLVGSFAFVDDFVTQVSTAGCQPLPMFDFAGSGVSVLRDVQPVQIPGMCAPDGKVFGGAGQAATLFQTAYWLVQVMLYGVTAFALWRMASGAFGSKG